MNMKRQFLSSIFCLALIWSAKAQIDPKLSVFTFNPLFYNPAFAGSGGGLSVIGIHSSQFTGFDGAPQTQYLSAHGLWEESNLGFGLDVVNDQFGATRETGMNANVSYYLRLTSSLRLAFGMKAGMNSVRIDYSNLNISEPDEDIIQNSQFNMIQPNVGFGFYLFSESFYFGLSTPSVFMADRYDPFELGVSARDASYFLMTGLRLPVNDVVTISPNILARRLTGAPTSYLTSVIADFSGDAFFGFNWEYKSSVGLMGGFRFAEQFKGGYAFDFPTNSLGRYTRGTHTLFVSFNLDRFQRASRMPCFYY
jgi:type IX secretion system PorP/SprF family membrane protein